MLVPLGQPGIEHGGVGDLHRLPMVGRGQRRLVAKADDDFGPILAKLLGQQHAGLERVEQPAIGQVERDADGRAERFGRLLGLGQPHFRARATVGVGSPSVRSMMPTE